MRYSSLGIIVLTRFCGEWNLSVVFESYSPNSAPKKEYNFPHTLTLLFFCGSSLQEQRFQFLPITNNLCICFDFLTLNLFVGDDDNSPGSNVFNFSPRQIVQFLPSSAPRVLQMKMQNISKLWISYNLKRKRGLVAEIAHHVEEEDLSKFAFGKYTDCLPCFRLHKPDYYLQCYSTEHLYTTHL